jgi:hypothetical protein
MDGARASAEEPALIARIAERENVEKQAKRSPGKSWTTKKQKPAGRRVFDRSSQTTKELDPGFRRDDV